MQTLFVSSTFKDMHYERDAIRDMALPKINTEAKPYGQEVSVCDLRWGINTLDLDGDEGSKKVLDVCLDQIDRCSPPMIVLLGNRYGYIPDNSIIRNAARIKQLELEQLEISVTALEIEYGFLSRKNKPSVLFYFRETINAPDDYQSEDAEHAAKLAELKSRILKVVGDNYRTYTVDYSAGAPDMSEFADMVAADVTQALLPEWKQKARLSTFELDRKTQWDFVTDRSAIFRGRDELIDDLVQRIERGDRRIVVKGASGSGKSMVFCRLACVLRARGYDVLPFVGGLTTESNDSLDVLRNTVVYLQNKLEGTPHSEILTMHAECRADEWAKLAASYIDKYCSAGNRLVVMVDAIDQLYDDDMRKSNAFVPDCYNKNFVFFGTCTDEFSGLDAGSVRIAGLTEAERRSVVSGIMSQYNRELDQTVVDAMVKLPAADNPLYLSFLVKRLLMMNKSDYDEISKSGGQMDAISRHQHSIISSCPDSAEEMCALLIDEAGKRINKYLIADVVKYIACSRFGLRQRDIAALTYDDWDMPAYGDWDTIDFLHFVMYMGDCFILRDDGRYDFSHKSIRQGILKSTHAKHIHDEIGAYFWSIYDDEIAQNEMLYHFIGADNKPMFYYYIVSMARAVLDNSKKDKSTALVQDAEFGILGERLMSAVEFTSDGGKWIAQAIEIAPCEDEETSAAFILSILGLLQTEMRLRVYKEEALAISEALLKYATRAQESGFDVNGLVFVAREFYGHACSVNNKTDEHKDIVMDNYAVARAGYRANPNDITLYNYICAVDSKMNMLLRTDDSDDEQWSELADDIAELNEIVGDRYDEEPNDMTARDNYYLLHDCAVWNFHFGSRKLMLDNVTEALECILPFALQYESVELGPIFNRMRDIADLASQEYIANVGNGLYDSNSDNEDDDDDVDVDDFVKQIRDCDSDEQKIYKMMEMMGSTVSATSGGEDDEDDDGEDDEEEESIEVECRCLKEAAELLYDAIIAIYLRTNEENPTVFASDACAACMKLSSIKATEGDVKNALKILDMAEGVIDELDSAGKLTQDTRDIACQIKTMRLKIRLSNGDTDYKDMLARAREILRDIDNISSDSYVHIKTRMEVLCFLIEDVYIRKLFADRAAGKLDLNDVTEAEALCNSLEALLSQMESFDDFAQEGLTAIRDLLASLKS